MGGDFFELSFDVVAKFGSGVDAVEKRAVFGERPVKGTDLSGGPGLSFGFWVGGLKEDEGDSVGREGEEDTEDDAA